MVRTREVVLLLLILLTSAAFGATRTSQGWLGLGFTYPLPNTPTEKRFLFVQQLAPGGPAAISGVREQDMIVAIDKKPITFKDEKAAIAYLHNLSVGQRVVFTIVRGHATHQVAVIASEIPPQYAPLWKRSEASGKQ